MEPNFVRMKVHEWKKDLQVWGINVAINHQSLAIEIIDEQGDQTPKISQPVMECQCKPDYLIVFTNILNIKIPFQLSFVLQLFLAISYYFYVGGC